MTWFLYLLHSLCRSEWMQQHECIKWSFSRKFIFCSFCKSPPFTCERTKVNRANSISEFWKQFGLADPERVVGTPRAPRPSFENCWWSVQNHELLVSVLILPLPLFHLFYLRPRGTLRGRGRNWGTEMSNRRLSHRSPSVTSALWVCGTGYFSFKRNQESQSLRRNQTHRMGKLTHSNRSTTEFPGVPLTERGRARAASSQASLWFTP